MASRIVGRRLGIGIGALSAVCALVLGGAPSANATTHNSWTGPHTADGIAYLHYSTITDTPGLVASSRIYTVNGNSVPPGTIGARARLFKSGQLCKATNYLYNSPSGPQVIAATTGDCGTGSYNSHGYVAAYDGVSAYSEIFTFPTNPLNFTAPSAQGSSPVLEVKSGSNAEGKSFGTAEGVRSDQELPDLVAAIATNGRSGYIDSAYLQESTPTSPADAAGKQVGSRTVPVYDQDGKTKVGDFTIG